MSLKAKKKISIELTEYQHTLIKKHAEKVGLGIGPYMRSQVIEKLNVIDSLNANRELLDRIEKEGLGSVK